MDVVNVVGRPDASKHFLPTSSKSNWASLVAQLVQNLPALRETWVHPLDWEDPLENVMAAHPSTPGKPPGEGNGCPPQRPWEALAGYFENMFMLSVLTLPPSQLPTVCGLG